MDVAAGKKEDIHLGHAFARGCNAAAHRGAKDAPQMPALLHGPRWIHLFLLRLPKCFLLQ